MAWSGLAALMALRGRGDEIFVVRRVDVDSNSGNSVERNQKIYAAGDPAVSGTEVRSLGYGGWPEMEGAVG